MASEEGGAVRLCRVCGHRWQEHMVGRGAERATFGLITRHLEDAECTGCWIDQWNGRPAYPYAHYPVERRTNPWVW